MTISSEKAPLRTARSAGVLTLILDRPDKRNALSTPLIEALHQELDRADLDAEVRVVVVRGAGKDFCAGADLEELLQSAGRTLAENEASALRLGQLFTRIRRLPKPVVAAVQGRALAGGAGLATACDLVLAHDEIAPLNYCTEWCPSMLKDAALATLALAIELLEHDSALQDAYPWNVVFKGTRPVFVDFTSIAPADATMIWPAYQQFLSFFLYPLELCSFGLELQLMANKGGSSNEALSPVSLDLDFDKAFAHTRVGAYERLLLDAIAGRLNLFVRSDEQEQAWRWVEPILNFWKQDSTGPRTYVAGSWGPPASSALVARDGHSWIEEC